MQVGRSALGRVWCLRACDERLALALSQRLGLDEVVGRVLAGRGIGLDAAQEFLEPRLRSAMPDPSHLHDLDRAAARIADAVEDGQTVGILGDYDVDGATSTALFVRYLRGLGIDSAIEIPDRIADGYGPNEPALARLAVAGCRLVVTLDTGTTAFAPLAKAAADGLDVVVIDHHAAEALLPRAVAVVNPNRRDQDSPLKHLAAVGVTFVVTVAVNRELRSRGFFRRRAEPDPRGGPTGRAPVRHRERPARGQRTFARPDVRSVPVARRYAQPCKVGTAVPPTVRVGRVCGVAGNPVVG